MVGTVDTTAAGVGLSNWTVTPDRFAPTCPHASVCVAAVGIVCVVGAIGLPGELAAHEGTKPSSNAVATRTAVAFTA